MAATKPIIDPFPDNIDRDAFGHWLSGLTDGEGTFSLCFAKMPTAFQGKAVRVQFIIKLRDDDAAVLNLIRSYWQGGTLGHMNREAGSKRKGLASLHVQKVADLANIVVPHFERFPLRAKKARDFQIWKRGVELFFEVNQRHQRSRPGQRGGLYAKWTDTEHEHFASLIQDLKNVRLHPDESIMPDF